jgi:hypothetical protein
VLLAESQPVQEVGGVEEFRELLVDRLNPDNHKGVHLGFVEWAHDVLAAGHCLLDVPGTGGASPVITEQVERHMSYVHRVVVVVRDRDYAPAAAALRRWTHVDVEAVVCNWTASLYEKVDVAARADLVEEYLGVRLPPERVFALNLPSLAPWIETRFTVEDHRHDAEAERFWRWVNRTTQAEATGNLLVEWEEAAASVAGLLEAHVSRTRSLLLHDDLDEDEVDRRERLLSDAVQAAARSLDLAYPVLVEQSGIRATADEAFASLSAEAEPVRARLSAASSRGAERRSGLSYGDYDVAAAAIDEIFVGPFADVERLEESARRRLRALLGAWREHVEPLLLRIRADHLPYTTQRLEPLTLTLPDFPAAPGDPREPSWWGALDRRKDLERVSQKAAQLVVSLAPGTSGELRAFWDRAVDTMLREFLSACHAHLGDVETTVILRGKEVAEGSRLVDEDLMQVRRLLAHAADV